MSPGIPSVVKIILQLESMCCNKQAEKWVIDHLQRFFPVAKVLLRFLMVKFQLFFGNFCWTLDQSWLISLAANFRIQKIINPKQRLVEQV